MGTMFLLTGLAFLQMPPQIESRYVRDAARMVQLQRMMEAMSQPTEEMRSTFKRAAVVDRHIIPLLRERGLTENDVGMFLMRQDFYDNLAMVQGPPANGHAVRVLTIPELRPYWVDITTSSFPNHLVTPWPPTDRYLYPPDPNAKPFKSPKDVKKP
jgi:hypothetical protein